MSDKKYLIFSITQLVIGALALISARILRSAGENMSLWAVAIVLSVAFVVMGIIEIRNYNKKK